MESESCMSAVISGGSDNVLTPYHVPARVTHAEIISIHFIGASAFENHRNLKEIVLRQGLRGIEHRAFFGCMLMSISIPSSVTEIGNHAFNSCENLKELNLSEGLQEIGAFAFYRCHRLEELLVPSSTRVIGMFAFSACLSLVSVKFQQGLRYIEKAAFCRCGALSTISIPSSVDTIGQQAFSGCSSLLNLELPREGSLKLLKYAFKDCSSLVNVDIPSSYFPFLSLDGLVAPLAFAGSALRLTADGRTKALSLVKDRYKDLPIHRACSSASETGIVEFRTALESNDRGELLDCFEMTPFHALATSPNMRLDYLNALLEAYSVDLITAKDQRGNTMIDYVLMQGPTKALPFFQLVLQRTLVNGIQNWGLPKWKAAMKERVNAFRWEGGMRARRERFSGIQTAFASYVQMEMISLLELALWKRKIQESFDRESTVKRHKIDRHELRTICGSNVVIGHVTKFLVNSSKQMMPLTSFQVSGGVSWMPGL